MEMLRSALFDQLRQQRVKRIAQLLIDKEALMQFADVLPSEAEGKCLVRV